MLRLEKKTHKHTYTSVSTSFMLRISYKSYKIEINKRETEEKKVGGKEHINPNLKRHKTEDGGYFHDISN